jgi:hypothetical protein
MLRPEAYPHAADDLELHETHGAWVILAGSYAYKVKKPVDFGFFDFSTAERRAADAEAELRLNRRLAPSVYLDVVDVVERDGRIFVGGRGGVLERAVQMRRLPADGMLTALLQRGAVTPTLVRRIARTMASFHASAATGPGIDEHGGYATLVENWKENFDQITRFVDESIPSWELAAIRGYVEHTLSSQRARFERRVAEGRVRDGHGDLHAGSICLDGDDLVIFDCIEFSARYRCADVAAEVAFLAMDLDHNARPDLGWAFVGEYVRRSGDRELVDLLDFYRCYRAFVRGKVLSLRLAETDLTAAERTSIVAEARAYFDLATSYAGGFPRPMLIAACGLPATGKSTLAAELARRLGMMVISTDVVRKRRAGLRPDDRAGAAFGTGLYRPATTQNTYAALRRMAATWLDRGISVVLDGTFGDRRQRQLARQTAQHTGACFHLVQTTCDEAIVRERLQKRERDPARASDATWQVYEQMQRTFVAPDELPPSERSTDDTGGAGADEIIRRLARHRQAG